MDKLYSNKRFLESRQESKIRLIFSLLLALVVVGFFAQYVRAQTTVSLLSDTLPAPSVVEIDATGNVLIRGVVESVDTHTLTITSWGGTWTILTGGNTSIIPQPTSGTAGDISQVSVGDFVGIEGVMATDQSVTAYAALIRNWTTNPYGGSTSEQSAADAESGTVNTTNTGATPAGTSETSGTLNTNPSAPTTNNTNTTNTTEAAVETETSLDDAVSTTYAGTVGEVSDTSFTFTDDLDSTYTVELTSDTVIVNNDDETIAVDDVSVGDRIELEGTAQNGVITTPLIRNVSDDGGFF